MADDPKVIFNLPKQDFTVASLSTAVGATGTAGIYTAIVAKPPVIEVAPQNHPVYELIGRATSAWARLEHTLDLIIWDLVGAPSETIACITAQIIGATNRYKTIEALLKQRKSPQLAKLVEKVDALKKRTYGPNEDRNRIIHDPWYLYDTKTAQFRAMPPKDPRFGVCVVDINDINTFIETANKLSSRAAEIRNEILAALRP